MTSSPSLLKGNCESVVMSEGKVRYIVFELGCLYSFDLAFKTIVIVSITIGIKNFWKNRGWIKLNTLKLSSLQGSKSLDFVYLFQLWYIACSFYLSNPFLLDN